MDAVIQLENLSKSYGQLAALRDVTLSIGRGVTGLLGPNGSGKSTLIKTLLGLVKLTSGRGEILGMDIRRNVRDIRSEVGYMPEDDCYIAGMTGIEMVRFSAQLAGLPAVEGLRRAHEIIDFAGLAEQRYRKVETYSTGMRQKLKFAQAIVHDPPLLILDEPTSGLDPEGREVMLQRIRILADKSDKTIVISTHILPDVQATCDSVVILAKGQVRVVETLEVLSRPASPTYQLRVTGNAQPFIDRLRSDGRQVDVEVNGTLTLHDPNGEVDGVWSIAQELGVGLRSLVPARNSLEQIFLDAVRGESQP